MQNVYFCCFAVGFVVLALQTLLSLFGFGHHDADGALGHAEAGHDLHHEHTDADSFVKWFTFKSVVAFVTFFGLVGLACQKATPPMAGSATFVFATLAGSVALWGVAMLMRSLARLQSKGNLRVGNTVGLNGKVYLKVPPRGEGLGKVTVTVQGRTHELKAMTVGPEIPTGAPVKVVATREPDTLEVVAIGDGPA
jgi:hypothetical protein